MRKKRKANKLSIALVTGLLVMGGLVVTQRDESGPIQSSVVATNKRSEHLNDVTDVPIEEQLQAIEHLPAKFFYLETVLLHGDIGRKKSAIRELRKANDAEAIGLLALALSDPDKRVRNTALEALNRIGSDEALAAISSAMYVRDPARRASAVASLASDSGYSAPDYLQLAIRDESAIVRQAAIEALGEIGDSRSINIISAALRDPDELVRERAAEILDELSDDAMFEVLYSAF